jgi:hypothetical protein
MVKATTMRMGTSVLTIGWIAEAEKVGNGVPAEVSQLAGDEERRQGTADHRSREEREGRGNAL